MNRHDLLAAISRIHEEFRVLTPKVQKISDAIGSTLSAHNKSGSLHIIIGDPGSGCSTAIQLSRRRVRRQFKHIVTLNPAAFDEVLNPWECLLMHYGLRYSHSDLRPKEDSIPNAIIKLIKQADIDCIIVEDFLEGLNKPEERRRVIEIWSNLARHPVCVNVILSTNNHVCGTIVVNDETATIYRIHNWQQDEEFSLYIDKLQKMLRDDFKCEVNLAGSKTLLYNLCSGNTGNLINLVREYAVAELLSCTSLNSLNIEFLPLMRMIKKNAILFTTQSSRR